MHNPLPQTVMLNAPIAVRFVRLQATTPTDSPATVTLEELGLFTQP